MVRGFYQLGAGMLTYNKKLSNTGSNIANAQTTGYKRRETVSSSFEAMVLSRMDGEQTEIGSTTLFSQVAETAAIHSQGAMNPTGRDLDFAIQNGGFFAVQGENGVVYTRKGSFEVDAEGYLTLGGVGRVLGDNGPLRVGTDQITADEEGNLSAGGMAVGRLAVYDFDDYNALQMAGEGLYTGAGAAAVQNPRILPQTLEGSNVDAAQEMTAAIAAQRGLQSCTQLLKMYDQVLSRASTEIGRIG